MIVNERVIIFIDGSNIFHAIRALNIKIDYSKLVKLLSDGKYLIRAYYYSSMPRVEDVEKDTPEWDSLMRQRKFITELKNMGIKPRIANLRKLATGEWLEKEVDIMLATDMLALAFKNAYDTAILVSGDSDFCYTVETIQDLGKRVINATFRRNSSPLLRAVSDEVIFLDEYIDQIVMERPKPKEEPPQEEEEKPQEEPKEEKKSFWQKLVSFFKSSSSIFV
ncbi:MAG: NYN domain-containing protein [Gammaproteobacteria bacterium]|nr:MAG: NYN domain-containing protein [Gammaproteobacteria bacterium]